jgi:site-specific recombinase XerD
MIVEGRSPKTLRQYSYSLKRFFGYIGNKPYDQVNAYDVRAWLASLKMSGSKNVSVRNQKNNITPFFTWLCNDGVIAKNPCAPIRPIKVEDEEKSPFSSEEVDIIRSKCISSRERAIVETLLSSGVRLSELCNLKISDVDFNTLTVHVRRGKGGKDRTTFITPVAKRHICIYLGETTHKSEYLFTSNHDKKYTSSGMGCLIRSISNKCNFHVHPHRFRRTLASELARKGMPIQEIQKLLGHNSIETTRRYTETKIDKVQASYKQYIA